MPKLNCNHQFLLALGYATQGLLATSGRQEEGGRLATKTLEALTAWVDEDSSTRESVQKKFEQGLPYAPSD